MSAHTPGPWEIDVTIYEHMCAGIRQVGGDTAPIAQVWRTDDRTGYANAEFIVRACNSHDALVEALRGLLDQFDAGYFVRNTESDGSPDWAFKAVRSVQTLAVAMAALAQAEGSEAK